MDPALPHIVGLSDAPSGSRLPQSLHDDMAALREILKRCSPETIHAACEFRRTASPCHLDAIVVGVIQRYVEPDLRSRLIPPDDALRLAEDLGIDSLTLMEIILLTEEVFQISLTNDEVRHLRTLGEVKLFLHYKLFGASGEIAGTLLTR